MRWRADAAAAGGRAGGSGRSGRALILASLLAGPALLAVSACERGTPAPAASTPFPASSAAVLLDGVLSEWSSIPRLIEDPLDAETSGIDLRWVSAVDDPGWLYLAFDVEREVNAQRMPGTLLLLIDADGEESTGGSLHGTRGVDLAVEVSRIEDAAEDGRGLGVGLRPVAPDGPAEVVSPYALDVVVAPTWSATEFEMRLRRGGSEHEGLPPLQNEIRIRAVYVEDGVVMDETPVAAYAFATSGGSPSPGTGARDRLARRDGAVRVAQLNVSSGSFNRSPSDFARLLAAVEPDVLLLDELPGDIDEERLAAFFAEPPLAGLGAWSFVLGRTGGRQRAMVAARALPVRRAAALEAVPYREGALTTPDARFPTEAREALAAEEEAGVSAAGAWITLPGGDVLFTVVDLASRGFIDSPEDVLRGIQATEVRNRVATEVRAAGESSGAEPPVVVGGDLNLVGSRVPMRLLSTRLYSDDTVLEPVAAERIGERTVATWRDPRQPFLPGRLDFLLTPPRRIEIVNAFVFATEDLADPHLVELGLERELSGELADHLVVVADLRVR